MQTSWTVFPFLIFGFCLISLNACKDDDDNDIPTTVIDFEGNTYRTVEIGDQVWMAENLRTTIYNDGSNIPHITSNFDWDHDKAGAYCWYNNDQDSLGAIYGVLYNWYAAATGKLCPEGWHVPNNMDWQELQDFLGGEAIGGGKLKEIGTLHWNEPNVMATDDFGFTALPGGARRATDGTFAHLGIYGGLWSSDSTQNPLDAWYWGPAASNATLPAIMGGRQNGWCVRCIQD